MNTPLTDTVLENLDQAQLRGRDAFEILEAHARKMERQLADARAALADIQALHFDPTLSATYCQNVRTTAARGLTPAVVEFCGGQTPELTTAYDKVRREMDDDLDEPLPPKQCGVNDDEPCSSCQ